MQTAQRAPERGGASPALLRMEGMTKRYGGIHAVEAGELVVHHPGEVHALMGTNGSGKSTMLKILSGEERADSGSIAVDGEQVTFHSAADAVAAGIALVSQETAVVPHLTVAENVMMGRLKRGALGVDWVSTFAAAAEVTTMLGLDAQIDAAVGTLRADQRQVVEIARAIATQARILILDEPTSSLADDRVQDLHSVIRKLSARGVAVILVSHRLDEVFSLSDRITIMRDGRYIESRPTSEYTVESLVRAMTGHDSNDQPAEPAVPRTPNPGSPAEVVLEMQGVSGVVLQDISLTVKQGEIVGIAGLGGSGRDELLATVFGAKKAREGAMFYRGDQLKGADPRSRIKSGIGYVPPDRATQGVVRPLSSTANLVLPVTSPKSLWARINRRDEATRFAHRQRTFGIRVGDPEAPVSGLSGGNQQKVVLGKWLELDLGLLLLEEPTRGIDVSARADIHDRLRELASDGLAVVVSSSETDELLTLCSRVIVLFGGQIIAERATEDLNENTLTGLIGGHL